MMKRKKTDQLFIFIFAAILSILAFAYFNKQEKMGKLQQKEFYNTQFSSLIVSSNSFYGRSVEFHLQNGFTLYFLPPINDKLIIGDSVKKDKETYEYRIYRKSEDGLYKYFATYNSESIQ